MNILDSIKNISKEAKTYLALLAIGLILIAVGIYIGDIWGMLLSTIGTIVLTNVLLEIIKNKFEEERYSDKICECLKSEVKAIKLGIKYIDNNDERELSKKRILNTAHKKIDIMHAYGYSWTSDNRRELIDALSRENLKMRVIILDFEDPNIVGIYNDIINGDFTMKCKDTLKLWREIYINSGENNNLEIYLFKGVITHCIHMNENNIIIKSIPTSRRLDALNISTIYAENIDSGIYINYENEINQIVNESRKYEIK